MPIKMSVEKKLERMVNSMTYHMTDVLETLSENINDPFFETEFGKDVMKHLTSMCGEHSLVCIGFMTKEMKMDRMGKEKEEEKPTKIVDLEGRLRDLL